MKWSISGAGSKAVACIHTKGYEAFRQPIAGFFADGSVPYSGIVVSNNEMLAKGSSVEKSCYDKGGFRFIYKSYADVQIASDVPVTQMLTVLTSVATDYLHCVAGHQRCRAEIDVAWAVCQRDGDYGTLHNHIPPGSDRDRRYSGMFYLQSPETISPANFPNGCLHIVVDDTALYYPPIPGSIVIWPAWMLHGIHPFRGQGDRLGIAFDFNRREG